MDPIFANISFREIGTSVLDLVMPRQCIACRRPLNLQERFLCLECQADFPYTRYWLLPHNPMADKFNALIQQDLDADSPDTIPPSLCPSLPSPALSGSESLFPLPFRPSPASSGSESPFLLPFPPSLTPSGSEPPFLLPFPPSPTPSGSESSFPLPFRPSPSPSGSEPPFLFPFRPSPTLSGSESSFPLPFRPSPARRYEPYAFAAALFFYNAGSDFRHIPWHLKYEGGLAAGRYFARMLGERLAAAPQFADVDVVVPVPLHWTRQWRRGYNQAEVIARELADVLGAELRTDILRRSRRTRSQVRLPLAAKAANVRGAFSLRRPPADYTHPMMYCVHSVTGCAHPAGHVLLVDDTFTTGSTLNACRAVLRQAFPLPTRISVATLAFVSPD